VSIREMTRIPSPNTAVRADDARQSPRRHASRLSGLGRSGSRTWPRARGCVALRRLLPGAGETSFWQAGPRIGVADQVDAFTRAHGVTRDGRAETRPGNRGRRDAQPTDRPARREGGRSHRSNGPQGSSASASSS
jgi:hypothetical protein